MNNLENMTFKNKISPANLKRSQKVYLFYLLRLDIVLQISLFDNPSILL